MKNVITLVSLLSLGLPSHAFGVSPDDARALRDSVERARYEVNLALSSVFEMQPRAEGGESFPSPSHSGGPDVWSHEEKEEILEDDAIAMPIYQTASNNLFSAGSLADQALIDLSSGIYIQEGTYKYAQACAKMAIARSQISRANLAASQTPVGNLQAFGPTLREVVVELNALHARCQ